MASEKQTYPYVPSKSWWALRKKFNQSIPAQVTPSYIVAVLGGTEGSARRNVLLGLKAVGLVDEDGSTTERAKLWRDDDGYADVSRQIVDELYPAELLSAVPGPAVDKGAAKRWFMAATGCGEPTAARMAATYALLAEGDPSAGDEAKASTPRKTTRAKSKGKATPSGRPPQPQPPSPEQDPPPAPDPGLELPEMRLNVEIRIDASVTPEQIDLIFASMAKHLYRRDDERQ